MRNFTIGESRGKVKSYSRLRCPRYRNCCLRLSFDSPATRSAKWIGTSRTLVTRHLHISSSAILYPRGVSLSARSKVDRPIAKNPDIGSFTFPANGRARTVAAHELIL